MSFLEQYLVSYPKVGFIINNPNLLYKPIKPPKEHGGLIVSGGVFINLWFDYTVNNVDIYSQLYMMNVWQQRLFVDICNQQIDYQNSNKLIKRGRSTALFKFEGVPIYGLKGDNYVINKYLLNDLMNTSLNNFVVVLNNKNEIIKTVGVESWKLVMNSKFKKIKLRG